VSAFGLLGPRTSAHLSAHLLFSLGTASALRSRQLLSCFYHGVLRKSPAPRLLPVHCPLALGDRFPLPLDSEKPDTATGPESPQQLSRLSRQVRSLPRGVNRAGPWQVRRSDTRTARSPAPGALSFPSRLGWHQEHPLVSQNFWSAFFRPQNNRPSQRHERGPWQV